MFDINKERTKGINDNARDINKNAHPWGLFLRFSNVSDEVREVCPAKKSKAQREHRSFHGVCGNECTVWDRVDDGRQG